MGALPSTKLQINFSTPSRTLINVYADDEVELRQLLDGLMEQAEIIGQAEQLFGAVSAAAPILQGAAPQAAIQAATQAPAASGGGLPPGVEPQFCTHGEMKFETGVSKAGNNYSIFKCPQNQCDAKWPPRKRG